ncbi:MAG: hypothetical protein KBS77_05085, partial [Bacteroidales bacterium]|nr:hypothetical protein [Candidatus Colicola faecequi]
MKKFYFLLLAALMMGGVQQANAQFFKNLVDKAADAAKKGVENRVTRTVEESVDKALDPKTYKKTAEDETSEVEAPAEEAAPQAPAVSGWTCPECGKTGNTGKFCDECGAKQPAAGVAAKPAAPQKKTIATEYSKSDFVPGDEVF